LRPGQQIAVNHDFTGHEFHRLVPPSDQIGHVAGEIR
jgi:hypothetical protein